MTEQHNSSRGYVQVYTGNGKGKTTAALGLALRAAGAEHRVFIAQFAKGRPSSERESLRRFHPQIVLKHYGLDHFIGSKPAKEDIAEAQRSLSESRQALTSAEYHVVILDEANVAVALGLFTIDDLLGLVDTRPERVELVITGRNAHPRLVEKADLVTRMEEVKHYYAKGATARPGIEQ